MISNQISQNNGVGFEYVTEMDGIKLFRKRK
jgi:hypothetical protein